MNRAWAKTALLFERTIRRRMRRSEGSRPTSAPGGYGASSYGSHLSTTETKKYFLTGSLFPAIKNELGKLRSPTKNKKRVTSLSPTLQKYKKANSQRDDGSFSCDAL